MFNQLNFFCAFLCLAITGCNSGKNLTAKNIVEKAYSVSGTGQTLCFDNSASIPCPTQGQEFYGQDGSIAGVAIQYQSNPDGTVTDLVTGLVWTQALYPETDWVTAVASASNLTVGGFKDWRLPNIKELYTLMNFSGHFSVDAASSKPFIDSKYFEFSYLPESAAFGSGPKKRFLDVQLWSATKYVATTMNGDATIFGVNFADGRIKGYPQFEPGTNQQRPTKMLARYVRGKPYGQNKLTDNGDGSTTDLASGLIWQTVDDGISRNWKSALQYCTKLNLSGQQDWRLPNAKELHTIVDYSRSPTTSNSAAISPPLRTTSIESYYWTSNTLLDGPEQVKYSKAAYFTFGRALGWMAISPASVNKQLIDVHGAGAQRSDSKEGNPADFPQGFGPQGDDVRINNYVRCVRAGR